MTRVRGWFDWRRSSSEQILDRLSWPVDGSSMVRRIPFWSPLAERDKRYLVWPKGAPREFWNRRIDGGPVYPAHVTEPGGKLPAGSPITYKMYG